MESFLSGRSTVAKLKPSGGGPIAPGDGFSPMFEPVAAPAAGPMVAPSAAAILSTSTAETAPHQHNVSVEIVRTDGVVQGIVVTCKCGERIELDCVY